MSIELSVVLISKNQDWNITRLIESVLSATKEIQSREILLVDSASEDQTIELAKQYPIDIYRLQPGSHLTPAAGRYIGFKHTHGEFTLFLDGDMELCPYWLSKALDMIKKRKDVAAITGSRIDLPLATTSDEKMKIKQIANDDGKEVEKGGGAAMYRRATLLKIGQFNPYLHSDEEPDLCLRLRYSGYKILKLRQTIVLHYSDPSSKHATKIARWKRKLYMGAGQNLRYNFQTEFFWPYLKERGFAFAPIFAILVGILATVWYAKTKQSLPLFLWFSTFVLFFLIEARRKGSFYAAVGSLLHRILIIDGTIRGFLKIPLDPKSYPEDFEVVQVYTNKGEIS
ncbi:MAG: glycosyltransferase [Deferribacteres bacterium]|nr:glycosyltransferase [candidate division KSB1 bacterium]MCB9504262.1 glycosyltransferase [Deferribacteres bacterium]